MGWTIPLVNAVGVEVIEHEHNHCGQCWATMRRKDRPAQPLEVEGDIRRDRRWNRGYLHRWENDRPQPLLPSVSPSERPLRCAGRLVRGGRRCHGPGAGLRRAGGLPRNAPGLRC